MNNNLEIITKLVKWACDEIMKKGIMHYVLALQECGYPAAAAVKCGVSASTLTSSIKRMEKELGVLLYDRGTRQLTQAGRIYAEACSKVLREEENLRKDLSAISPRKFSLGHTSYVDHRLISQLSMELFYNVTAEGTNCVVEFPEDAPPATILNGDLDLFLSCQGPSPSSRLAFIPLVTSPLFLVISEKRPVDPLRPMKSVGGLKLIALFQGTALHRQQILLAKRAGTSPEILMETNSLILTQNLINDGIGYTIVNKGTAKNLSGCRCCPIPNSSMTMGLWLLKEREDIPQIMKICKVIQNIVFALYQYDEEVDLHFTQEEN